MHRKVLLIGIAFVLCALSGCVATSKYRLRGAPPDPHPYRIDRYTTQDGIAHACRDCMVQITTSQTIRINEPPAEICDVYTKECRPSDKPARVRELPAGDVYELEIDEVSFGRSMGLILALALGGFYFVYLAGPKL
jgi:hypothetical protein